jgi:hypothetical protein
LISQAIGMLFENGRPIKVMSGNQIKSDYRSG